MGLEIAGNKNLGYAENLQRLFNNLVTQNYIEEAYHKMILDELQKASFQIAKLSRMYFDIYTKKVTKCNTLP